MSLSSKNITSIDSALGLTGEFSKVSKNTVSHISKMRQEAIFTDGAFPSKIKALAAALWGVSVRCEPCFKYYILKAKEFGATVEEVGEFLAIASAMGGCVGEMWALKAFQAFKEGTVQGECCDIHEEK